jgi:hypothetical protein
VEHLRQLARQPHLASCRARHDANCSWRAYYRVRLGPFATKAQAAQVAYVLKEEGHAIFVDAIPALARPVPLPDAWYAWRAPH